MRYEDDDCEDYTLQELRQILTEEPPAPTPAVAAAPAAGEKRRAETGGQLAAKRQASRPTQSQPSQQQPQPQLPQPVQRPAPSREREAATTSRDEPAAAAGDASGAAAGSAEAEYLTVQSSAGEVKLRLLYDGRLEVNFPPIPDTMLEESVWFRDRDRVDSGGRKHMSAEEKVWKRGASENLPTVKFSKSAVRAKLDKDPNMRCDIAFGCERTRFLLAPVHDM